MRVCMLAEGSVQGRIAMAVSIPPSRPRPGRPQHDHQVSTNESRPRKVCRQAQCSPGRRSSGACGRQLRDHQKVHQAPIPEHGGRRSLSRKELRRRGHSNTPARNRHFCGLFPAGEGVVSGSSSGTDARRRSCTPSFSRPCVRNERGVLTPRAYSGQLSAGSECTAAGCI